MDATSSQSPAVDRIVKVRYRPITNSAVKRRYKNSTPVIQKRHMQVRILTV